MVDLVNLCAAREARQIFSFLRARIQLLFLSTTIVTMTTQFSSEGFDLDGSSEDVILEVGGGMTKIEPQPTEKKTPAEKKPASVLLSPIQRSEELKAEGNACFKNRAYLDAYDMYTEAIEACPGQSGKELLEMKEQFEEKERSRAIERHRKLEEERRKSIQEGKKDEIKSQTDKPEEFKPPPHVYGDKLAVYHCNRAACLTHLNRYEEALTDCNIAVLLNPTYTKAWMRRSNAYEMTERIEEAFGDMKKALESDPGNSRIRKEFERLKKLEDERMEKLKAETMDKLKDLGNSLLGNFGLSLDNFQATQDPNTGSYNISFNQNANKASV